MTTMIKEKNNKNGTGYKNEIGSLALLVCSLVTQFTIRHSLSAESVTPADLGALVEVSAGSNHLWGLGGGL